MSEQYPAEALPMAPLQNPAFDPTPQSLLDELRTKVKVLSAAFNHLTSQMGRVTLDMAGIQVDMCPAVDVVLMPGRTWRVRVDRPEHDMGS